LALAYRLQSSPDVSEASLDPEELAAIQAAIRQTAPAPRTGASAPVDAAPLPLIASDREVRSARPRLLAIATPWARQLERALRTYVGADVRIDVIGAEIVDGRALREELGTAWKAAIRPGGKTEALVIAVGGAIVECAAARRCGAAQPVPADQTREPSAIAIRLFEPAGRACVTALSRAWSERETIELADAPTGEAVEALYGSDVVIAVTLTTTAPCAGRIKLFALPGAAAAAAARLESFRAEAKAAARALGNVPVELTAVLGTVELSLAALRDLAPGQTFTLPTFIDSAVPIYCAGVLKAHGKPVVSRGVIAVEIESVVTDRGAK
jgi:flagellar motor switch/type III secretory pathway protein FliN